MPDTLRLVEALASQIKLNRRQVDHELAESQLRELHLFESVEAQQTPVAYWSHRKTKSKK